MRKGGSDPEGEREREVKEQNIPTEMVCYKKRTVHACGLLMHSKPNNYRYDVM